MINLACNRDKGALMQAYSELHHRKISKSIIDNVRMPNKTFSLVEENLNKSKTAQKEKARADAYTGCHLWSLYK